MNLPRYLSVFLERRYKTAETDLSAIGEEFRYFGYSSDVFLSILFAEAQIAIQATPDVVAVQTVSWNTVVY